jgi:inhibitor of cysteine peptidase
MAEIDLDPTKTDQRAAATIGDEVVVTLDETPTSGYRWVIDGFDEAILAPLESTFLPPTGDRLGAPGARRFRFAVVGTGSAGLSLVNRRTWDPDADDRRFEATIDATGGGPSAPSSGPTD